MSDDIDVAWLGARLRRMRKKRNLTLQEVSDKTGIKVATLSRIERGGAKNLRASTLLALSEWMGGTVETFAGKGKATASPSKDVQEETPDIVELHLRADKHLQKDTAKALANLFRTAYEHYKELQGKKG